ncbi:Nif3-like dinuclear metal center hexameric protein [Janibacter sp. Soil728]|uniref:Nif3-like dinuclear metal center hexameric protein n=1 Tax=Janibacter sp. Soil728 TaxID=1736393 RepID=UPI000700961C|nr:Nif3-like dinuclear metal center hexameric protein [Janibacter sp. Soil728]KRE38003.1 Nif3-like dinuclear metal center hexameric protein [Janibacter sp. Soil728]
MTSIPLRDVLSVLEDFFPSGSAQSWDRVGLVSGDPEQPIRRVHAAVDPTLEVVQEARDAGADLIITHHPLLLRGVHSVATTSAKGATVTSLVVGDVALYVAHTNADVAEPGVNTALAAACGLTSTEPLTIEEGRSMGRVGDLDEPVSLADFATRLAGNLPSAPSGIRVAGPADGVVRRVALLGGAGDGLIAAAAAAGADVYVTSDLRHHPVLEAREEAAIAGGTPFLVDAGHWATESLWLGGMLERLGESLAAAGHDVVGWETHVSTICTDPWSFTVGARTDQGDPQ